MCIFFVDELHFILQLNTFWFLQKMISQIKNWHDFKIKNEFMT